MLKATIKQTKNGFNLLPSHKVECIRIGLQYLWTAVIEATQGSERSKSISFGSQNEF